MTVKQAWKRHPAFKWVIGIGVFIFIAEVLIHAVLPAWAVIIPLTNRIVIDLGDAAQLVTALVAAAGFWRIWKAEKRASEAATVAATGVAKIEALAVKVDGVLAERDKASELKGQAKEKLVGEETAATLAEGQRQGMEKERASVAAQGAAPTAAVGGKVPLPVADDRTAGASERSADALERSAGAAERSVPAPGTKEE